MDLLRALRTDRARLVALLYEARDGVTALD
jgi:hypothetical protein